MRHLALKGRRLARGVVSAGAACTLLGGALTVSVPAGAAEDTGIRLAQVRTKAQASGAVGTPTGFAALPGWGQNGTTGGAGGPTMTVRTASAFLAAIARTGPLIIQVDGMITLPGPMHNVTSDKTIIGLGRDSGLTGGGLNIGLGANDSVTSPPTNRIRNVIIQNLTFRDWADDAVNVQMFSHHVWIDHNTFVGGYDGAADVKRGSSFVTVSWNHSTHGKNMLVLHFEILNRVG